MNKLFKKISKVLCVLTLVCTISACSNKTSNEMIDTGSKTVQYVDDQVLVIYPYDYEAALASAHIENKEERKQQRNAYLEEYKQDGQKAVNVLDAFNQLNSDERIELTELGVGSYLDKEVYLNGVKNVDKSLIQELFMDGTLTQNDIEVSDDYTTVTLYLTQDLTTDLLNNKELLEELETKQFVDFNFNMILMESIQIYLGTSNPCAKIVYVNKDTNETILSFEDVMNMN